MFPNTLNKHLQTPRSHASESIQAIKCLELERKSASVSYSVLGQHGLSWGSVWRTWCWRHVGAAWRLAPVLCRNPCVCNWAPAAKWKLSLVLCWFNQLVVLDKYSQSNIKWSSLSCILSQCYSSTFHVESKVEGGLERADICVHCAVKGNEHRGLWLKCFKWIWK